MPSFYFFFLTRVCTTATKLKLAFLRVNFCVMYFGLLLVLYGGNWHVFWSSQKKNSCNTDEMLPYITLYPQTCNSPAIAPKLWLYHQVWLIHMTHNNRTQALFARCIHAKVAFLFSLCVFKLYSVSKSNHAREGGRIQTRGSRTSQGNPQKQLTKDPRSQQSLDQQ